MEIRFTLDPQFDAELIARISERSNNSSENRAAKFLMRHWSEMETKHFSLHNQRVLDGQSSNSRPNGDEMEDRAAALADDW